MSTHLTDYGVWTSAPAPPPYSFEPPAEDKAPAPEQGPSAAVADIAAAAAGSCDGIADLDAWFACEDAKRQAPHPLAPPPPPPNPVAVVDCDATSGSMEAWFECEDTRRQAMAI